MNTGEVARVLDEMGTLLELQGGNPFRCRAYHNAAQAVRALEGDLAERVAAGSLGEIAGIGETMREKIAQLVTTGSLPAFDELKAQTPPGLVALLRVPGLGPKKIKALRDELNIQGLPDLRAAAESGRIAALKGFGKTTEAKILEGIRFAEAAGDRILQSTARRLVAPVVEALRNAPEAERVEVCGSLRRRAETIGDLDVLVATGDARPLLDRVVGLPNVAEVIAHGSTKTSVRLLEGVQCDVRAVTPEQFPFALHYFTGSQAHNIAIRKRARQRGLKLNEYELAGPDGPIACATEEDLFRALELRPIPPELREEIGEIEAAERGPIDDLVTLADLQGTFHCHTDWSDGGNTLEEMAEAAMARGLKYLGIADHSRSAGYAGGLSVDRVRRQWEAIDALNGQYGQRFRILKGIECDILKDGRLDYGDELLAGFDYVVASVHSHFGLAEETMTRRLIAAARHPLVTMIGHPTGRLLLKREAYELDLDALIDTCAAADTMIEINANPHRLDLDAPHCRKAKAAGVGIAINPDAHATGGLDDLDYGVGVARRAWLTSNDIFNSRSTTEVLADFEARRAR